VWLSCGGRNEQDKEHLGKIAYFPEQGFPGYYYPFRNQIGFKSPVVAMYIEDPTRKFSNTSFCNYVSITDQYIQRFKFSTL
jgi:Sodium / potassium ATPase beta chain.